jgi:hypothetical protein
MRQKHKEFVKEGVELALGFTFIGNFISVGKFLKKWIMELVEYARN